jgi:hypothetical protein
MSNPKLMTELKILLEKMDEIKVASSNETETPINMNKLNNEK